MASVASNLQPTRDKMTENGLFSCQFEAHPKVKTESNKLLSSGDMLLTIFKNHYNEEHYTFKLACDRLSRVGGETAALSRID